jgi:hypothetical protein
MISTTTRRIVFDGDDSKNDRVSTFVFWDAAHVVIWKLPASGTPSLLSAPGDYSVSIATPLPGFATITPAVAIATGDSWICVRVTPDTQEYDYTGLDKFPSASHENNLDRAAARDQELRQELASASRLQQIDDLSKDMHLPLKADRLGKLSAWDSVNGEPEAVDILTIDPEAAAVSAQGKNILEATTPAGVRAITEAQDDVIDGRGQIVRGSSGDAAEKYAKGDAGKVLTAGADDAIWDHPSVRGQISGFDLNVVSGNTDALRCAAGECRAADGSVTMYVDSQSPLGRCEDAEPGSTWVEDEGPGGMAEGETWTDEVYVYVFLVAEADGSDVQQGFDTDVGAANLLADSNVVAHYTEPIARLIGLILRNTGDDSIEEFSHIGDDIWFYKPSVYATDTNLQDARVTYTLLAALALKAAAILNIWADSGTDGMLVYLSNPAMDDEDPVNDAAPLATIGTDSAIDNVFQQVRIPLANGEFSAKASSANDTVFNYALIGLHLPLGRLP